MILSHVPQDRVCWSRLGSPEEPVDVEVVDLGVVSVTTKDIGRAREQGGDPVFMLIDVTAVMDPMSVYRLGRVVPGDATRSERIFLSSTYEDLADHRKAVIQALTELGADVRGMEAFGARTAPPKEVCLREVRGCGIYVGVFATRYGTIDQETGKSMTHLEYEEARDHRLDIRVYLPDPDWAVPTRYVDEGAAAVKLGELKAELRLNHTYAKFTTPEGLAEQVCRDLFPDRWHERVGEANGLHAVPPTPARRTQSPSVSGVDGEPPLSENLKPSIDRNGLTGGTRHGRAELPPTSPIPDQHSRATATHLAQEGGTHEMATTVTSAFQILRQTLEVTGLQASTVSTRQQNVRNAVSAEMTVLSSFLTGSYARHTMITPLSEADVDIFMVLDPVHYEQDGHTRLLDKLKRVLQKQYPTTSAIGRDGQAVTIRFSDFAVDVVPAFNRSGGGYLIPDTIAKRWMSTDPTVHTRVMADANTQSGQMLVPVVKMIKGWNRVINSAFDGFYLELAAKDIFANVTITDFPTGVRFFFDKGRQKIRYKISDPAGYGDLINPLRSVSTVDDAVSRFQTAYDRAIKAERLAGEGKTQYAVEEWRKIFGTYFPAWG